MSARDAKTEDHKAMKLYHTSDRQIERPDIYRGRKNADFGQGFYLTPDSDFAVRWDREGAVINEYELDLTGLSVHTFSREQDWFDYIFKNRRAQDGLEADVVTGPIANDTIYDTFGITTSGFLSREASLRLLLIGPEYTQTAVKSEKAASQLVWLGARKVGDVSRCRKIVKEEEEEFQRLFAEEMEKISGEGSADRSDE